MTSARAVVSVEVATVWQTPDGSHSLDATARATHPDIVAWLAGLGTPGRLDVMDRVVTQALLGETVLVSGEDAGWSAVELAAQPGRYGSGGYPGWLLSAHLCQEPTASEPGENATVTARLAATIPTTGERVVLSCGTRLPVLGATSEAVTLRAPDGRALDVEPETVAPAPPCGESVLRIARQWTGVPYLWGGCSGYGVDCSGLAHLAHRAAGLVIPRDAADQAAAGVAVAAEEAAPGDLLFFTRPGESDPHHVAVCAGPGLMLHSPRTGCPVEEIATTTEPYRRELLPFARRYTVAAGPG